MLCAPAVAYADDPDTLVPVPVGSVEVRDLPRILDDGTLMPDLQLPPVAVVVPARAPLKRKAARIKHAAPVVAVGDGPVVLGEGPLALNLTGPKPSDISSGAALKLTLPDGAVKAEAKASAGKEDGEPAFWHKDSARVDADLSGPLGTALSASGENSLSLTYRAPESVGASDQSAHLVRTESRTASANLTLPINPLTVTVGGDSTNEVTQEGAPGTSFAQSAVRTTNHTAFVDAEWQPLGILTVKGGAALRATGIRLQDAHTSSYRSLAPNLSATVKPLRDTTLSAKVEQTVAPYDAAAFANYANAAKTVDASGFAPDHAWRIETRLEQRLGRAHLTATYTTASRGTVTEFAEVGGVQAPATTPLKDRQSVAVALNLPLAGVGLPGTEISTEAQWRASRVVDPVTGTERTASGETGHQLTLRLKHQLPARHLSIGLSGQYSGTRSSYQVNELSSTEAGGSVGAFVSYQPSDGYEIDLNVDGLYGGGTRDDFFVGTRGFSKIARSAFKDNSGASLKLSLKRPF